jgi:hypothetical protein
MNIAYYPIQGNHDVFPVNVQDFSYPYANENILGMADAWSSFLDANAIAIYK